MSDRLKALREKRGKAGKAMRDLIDQVEKENRDMTDEELATHGKLFDETENLRQQIEAEERTIETERRAAEDQAEAEERAGAVNPGRDGDDRETREAAINLGFRSWLRSGGRFTGEGAEAFRAYQTGIDTEGGYVVPPQEMLDRLIQGVNDRVFIRQRAAAAGNLFQLPTADSLGVPTLDTDAEDADWTTELETGNEEDTLRIGKRELRPHPLAKLVKISKTLRRKAPRFDQIVMDRLAYKVGVTLEKGYLTGSGASQPLGVFTASSDGISTGRDVATGNTSTSITADGLIEAKFKLKEQYWGRADWLFHRDAVKQIAKLKDGDGQYMWRMSMRDGEPDRLMGRPLMISEYAPNTFTTGLYVGIFGDFSHYWIVEAMNLQIQVLVELYAATNQDGFIERYEGDGAPVLEEAFARVTLG